MSEFRPDWASPPYDSLFDILESEGKSEEEAPELIQNELELTDNLLADFMLGDFKLRPGMCEKLGKWVGPNTEFWINRESQFQEQRERLHKVLTFWNRLWHYSQSGVPSKAVDMIYTLDAEAFEGDRHYVSLIMRRVAQNFKDVPLAVGLSLLTMTVPVAEHFESERQGIYEACCKSIKDKYGDVNTAEWLFGLMPERGV